MHAALKNTHDSPNQKGLAIMYGTVGCWLASHLCCLPCINLFQMGQWQSQTCQPASVQITKPPWCCFWTGSMVLRTRAFCFTSSRWASSLTWGLLPLWIRWVKLTVTPEWRNGFSNMDFIKEFRINNIWLPFKLMESSFVSLCSEQMFM